jgi:uncharacterized protein (DUF1778 family)
MSKQPARLNMRLSQRQYDTIEELANDRETTMTRCVIDAVTILSILQNLKRNGRRVFVEDERGNPTELTLD